MEALSNVRVLDFTHYVAGPYCTKLLADYGADVLKVERPGAGDPARRLGPFPGDVPHPERSGLFLHLNTNKRSVTLNLKSREGAAIARRLCESAHLVVESFRPGVMEQAGAGLRGACRVQSAARHDVHIELRAGRALPGMARVGRHILRDGR